MTTDTERKIVQIDEEKCNGFHGRYLKNKPVIIACPKLEDKESKIAKMAEVLRVARPASLTVPRMEVPC